VVLTRELADAAGVPLPDRYGYAASDAVVVHAVVGICVAQPDDGKAVDEIGMANFVGDINLAMRYDTPTDEKYEQRIVAGPPPAHRRPRNRRRPPPGLTQPTSTACAGRTPRSASALEGSQTGALSPAAVMTGGAR